MQNTYFNLEFGPKKPVDIKIGTLYRVMRRSEGLSENMTYLEKAAALATLQLGSMRGNWITIDCSGGTIYETWNVYYEGNLVFTLGESLDGYVIRYYAFATAGEWLPELCKMAENNAKQFGRR